jgi:hypothetical protein
MKFLILTILSSIILCSNSFSQNIPSDFKFEATTAGTAPWSDMEVVNILANGQVEFTMTQNSPPQIIIDTTFNLDSAGIQGVWQTLQMYSFFSLDTSYIDSSVKDGSIALLNLTANGNTKQILARDSTVYEIQGIIDSVNSILPAKYKLNYTPPEEIYSTPSDPCGISFGYSIKPDNNRKFSKHPDKTNSSPRIISNIMDTTQSAHGGVEIGYEMSLADAVASGRATLTSKGAYFGDAVSITGDNPKYFPPSGNTIAIKLNLEFYGPCDNHANEAKIENDISKKWDGLKSSNGKTIKIEFATLSNPGKSSPQWIKGYDYIEIACGNGRSSVNGIGSPTKDGTNSGKWYIGDTRKGIFGHEAGHLMGFDDHYDDWKKLGDGSEWMNESTGLVYSASDFISIYDSRFPQYTDASNRKVINKYNELSVPRKGYEHDLMAVMSQPPLQSEIDQLVSEAGLIIHVKAGDMLSNSDNTAQNLVITHTQDLFLNPGQSKTLNGIFTACVDAYKSAPYYASTLDVAPSLDEWTGIPSAQYLLKIATYADSLIDYCGDVFDIQNAVWRISDNVSTPTSTDTIFNQLGINLGSSILHFPKLENNLTNDSVSTVYIPDELFVPDIQPKSVQAGIGENLSFTANLLKPSGYNYSTSYSWFLTGPGGSSSQISSNGSFAPDMSGIYDVSLKMNISGTDVKDTIGYIPDTKSFVVVPNKFTETFEHPGLSDKLPWQTSGDTKWHITNKDAETGNYSATSGNVLYNQSSTIEIYVNLPKDSVITFAAKLLSNEAATLEFDVDSNYTDSWSSSMDWHFHEYQLTAGKHLLTWELYNPIDGPSQAWLDNIFFPSNSVVVGVSTKKNIPQKFKLFQNYPNPFNPSTKIKFNLASAGHVSLIIYNTLGQKVKELINNFLSAGQHSVIFNGKGLTSGVYYYRLNENGRTQIRKMILLK